MSEINDDAPRPYQAAPDADLFSRAKDFVGNRPAKAVLQELTVRLMQAGAMIHQLQSALLTVVRAVLANSNPDTAKEHADDARGQLMFLALALVPESPPAPQQEAPPQ